MGLARVQCAVCRIGSLWTDDPKGFLEATCPTPGHCQAVFLEGDFVSAREGAAPPEAAEPVSKEAPAPGASVFTEAQSHEIRSLLNVILGYDSLLAQRLDEEHRERQVASIRRAVARLEQILAPALGTPPGLVAAARPRALDLVRVLRRSVRRQRPAARRRHVAIETRLREADAAVFLSSDVLSGTLDAMLRKAVESVESAAVAVTLARDPDGPLRLEIHVPQSVDADALHVDPELETLGRRLEDEGARLSVEAADDHGTRLSIHFARSCELRSISRGSTPEPTPIRGRKQIVLVVEDDPDTRAFLRAVLRKHFDVELAADAAEARRILSARTGQVRAVVMDVHLPGEDGLSLTRSLRALPQWKRVPIIAATAYAFPEDRARALAAGCDDYLAKPFPPAELVSRIERFRTLRH